MSDSCRSLLRWVQSTGPTGCFSLIFINIGSGSYKALKMLRGVSIASFSRTGISGFCGNFVFHEHLALIICKVLD